MDLMRKAKASLRDYIRKFMAGDSVDEYSGGGYFGGVDRDIAMKYSAVYACIRVLGETFASCPVVLYKKRKDGSREASKDLAVYDILHNQPNDEMAPFVFKETCMASMNTGGNSVSVRLKNKFGDFIGLYPLDWEKLRIERKNGVLRYYYRDGPVEKEYAREDVFHVPGLSFDGIIGVSPLEYMANSILLGLNYDRFGLNFYKNGANTSGIYEHPGNLSDEAFARLKNDLAKNYAGMGNCGKPMILEGGMKFTPVTIKPVDAQLIESKKFAVEDVARGYRMPLHMIQNLDKATNNNIEHQSLEFVMYTMLPWFKRYEENVNAWLLTPRERKAGYFTEFKIDGLLRGDSKSRAEAYAAGRQWGWLSVNDIRRLENMPPIDNGDRYLEPLNFTEAGAEKQATETAGAETAGAETAEQISALLRGGERN